MQYRTTSYAEGVFDTYWFEKNLQGDIVAVYNDAGTLLVKYTYDAWGNTVSTTYSNGGSGTIVRNNRFRYRGYYYDIETGFYYLNSRYYDPNTGRFINEDGQLNMDNLLGTNLYAYCGNNPVIYLDYLGDMWQLVPQLDPRNRYYGAGGSGFSGGSWDSSAYNTYQIRSLTAAHDASLGGYYYDGWSSACYDLAYYTVAGAVSVTDNMAGYAGSSIKGSVYYHVTTAESANSIISSHVMRGSDWEGGYVFAWCIKPDRYAMLNSGANIGTCISFRTDATFGLDGGITNSRVLKFRPVRSDFPGPIRVWDVHIVD